MLVDNFKGHTIGYKPTNIELEFLAPNMTAGVQPLDAGAIHDFKLKYRHLMCLRAIDLDEAGEDDIYKLNVLEAILLVEKAWDSVSKETIRNCWAHTRIEEPANMYAASLS